MNQEKIGKFIASCRKKQKLTQEQLAEKLGITYKAVSKWETGKGLPDASIMMDLCNILEISVNDLLSGEKIAKEQYEDKVDENLIKLQKQKEFAINSARWTHVITVIIFLIWNGINVFKYGVECYYQKGSPLVHHVNVIIIDVTSHELLVDVKLMNRL